MIVTRTTLSTEVQTIPLAPRWSYRVTRSVVRLDEAPDQTRGGWVGTPGTYFRIGTEMLRDGKPYGPITRDIEETDQGTAEAKLAKRIANARKKKSALEQLKKDLRFSSD